MGEYEVECWEGETLWGTLIFANFEDFSDQVGFILELFKFDKLILKIKNG